MGSPVDNDFLCILQDNKPYSYTFVSFDTSRRCDVCSRSYTVFFAGTGKSPGQTFLVCIPECFELLEGSLLKHPILMTAWTDFQVLGEGKPDKSVVEDLSPDYLVEIEALMDTVADLVSLGFDWSSGIMASILQQYSRGKRLSPKQVACARNFVKSTKKKASS